MFSFTRSRSRLRIKNSRSRSRPKTGRLRNPGCNLHLWVQYPSSDAYPGKSKVVKYKRNMATPSLPCFLLHLLLYLSISSQFLLEFFSSSFLRLCLYFFSIVHIDRNDNSNLLQKFLKIYFSRAGRASLKCLRVSLPSREYERGGVVG